MSCLCCRRLFCINISGNMFPQISSLKLFALFDKDNNVIQNVVWVLGSSRPDLLGDREIAQVVFPLKFFCTKVIIFKRSLHNHRECFCFKVERAHIPVRCVLSASKQQEITLFLKKKISLPSEFPNSIMGRIFYVQILYAYYKVEPKATHFLFFEQRRHLLTQMGRGVLKATLCPVISGSYINT